MSLHFKPILSLFATATVAATMLWSCSESNEPIEEKALHVLGPADALHAVNPFVGTGGHGHTYPGATVPFGMVQLSPDTRLDGWDGCGGYHYSDSVIYGFSHTHLSGTGVSDYGDVLFMPMSDAMMRWENGSESSPEAGYASRFSKDSEVASPGYYSCDLSTYDIKAELTATERVGVHRYTAPSNKPLTLIVDLEHRDKVLDSYIKQVSDNEIEGYRISQAWAEEQHVYFVARFSAPMRDFVVESDPQANEAKGTEVKGAALFSPPGAPLVVTVGISAVSIEGARKNLDAEMPDFDFDRARTEAEAKWARSLGKISITGGTQEEQRTFYTALYHTQIVPNIWNDVDGQYRGHDMQVHQADNTNVYTVFSLWDTFRAAHPLYTILEQKRTNEFINTFLLNYEQGGVLPVWELAANETYCMIGYHSVPVIADAWAKGLRDWDWNTAANGMLASANADRFGLDSYQEFGFIRGGDEAESVSKTLEYAYDDWCIAYLMSELAQQDVPASELEFESIASKFNDRAQNYKNVYDPKSGFFRGRMHGSWFDPFDPREVNFHFTEANAWQYSTFVPHDISGMIELFGGEAAFEEHLDNLFTAPMETTGRDQADITGLIGQYAHGNEPSHHMAYLYSYIGKPWKTQERVRQILDEFYTDQPDGYIGNEDCGQMSAWYVMSALGIYPVTPGLPYYTFGTPLFPEATLKLENGNSFTIKAKDVTSTNRFIQSVTLNGKPHEQSFILHDAIMAGGELVFEMGPKPNMAFGTGANQPVARIDAASITTAPYFEADGRTFTDTLVVTLKTVTPNSTIYFTTDGSEPTETDLKYEGPIVLRETVMVKAIAVANGKASSITEARYLQVEGGRTIQLNSQYENQYAAGGGDALVDFIRGPNEYRTGFWQGFRDDLDAVVDLGEKRNIRSVGAGFLQDVKSWIWMPTEIEFAISDNGKDFVTVGTVETDIPDDKYGSIIKDFWVHVNKQGRYVRVRAKQYGTCPEWHLGAGGKTWIFADEILVE